MTTDREKVTKLAHQSGMGLFDHRTLPKLEAFYHASRKPLLDALEAKERENAELKRLNVELTAKCNWYNADGARLERERDSLAEQVKVLMQAIIDYRKGNLLAVARASSDDFAKNADLADWDEIDLEESLASSALFRIADAALATGGK